MLTDRQSEIHGALLITLFLSEALITVAVAGVNLIICNFIFYSVEREMTLLTAKKVVH